MKRKVWILVQQVLPRRKW